jgi:hypothetical protein
MMTPVIDQARTRGVSTLLDRLELATSYALTTGRATSDRGIVRRAVALGAKVSPSYIGTIKTRLRKEDPDATKDYRKLAAIAKACGVRPSWLLDGEGQMEMTSEDLLALAVVSEEPEPSSPRPTRLGGTQPPALPRRRKPRET